MIQINELRIGNLIERNGIFAKIEIINNELDEVYFMGEDFYYSDFCCNIKPIPLTEEWLIKFGFACKGGGVWFLDLFEIHVMNDGKIYLRGWMNGVCKLNHVHQLQNLYFALTGDELTVA